MRLKLHFINSRIIYLITLKHFVFILATIFLLGCASHIQQLNIANSHDIEKANSNKAYSHYLNGALYDFQDQYEKAFIEYQLASLFDSSSAQIQKAIARNLIRMQEYEGAIKHLQKSHKLNPKDLETLNYLAESYYHLNKFQESIRTYKKLFSLDPYNTNVQNNLIYLYNHLKMDEELAGFYKNMMEHYPGNIKFNIQYALVSIRQHNLNEAQKILEDVVKKDSSQLEALLVLGNLYEANKDTTNAIYTYRNILSQDPNNEEILNRLYRIYRTRREWEQIESIYRSIINHYHNHSQARLILGETYYYQKKWEEAKAVTKPVLNDENYSPAAYELLGRIAFEEENYDEAENYFNQVTILNPQNRYGWIFLVIIYNRQEQYEKSLRVMQDALTIHTNDIDLLGMYGSTLSEAGRNEDALEPLEKALKLDQDNITTVSSIAAVYDKLKMWNKSDSLYQESLKKYPDNALLLNNYSYSLAQRGIQLDLALDLATRALESEPDNGAYLDTKGWVYFKMGQYDLALEHIKKALDSREESAEVLEHLGEVYFKLGQTEQARHYWEKAFEKDPANSELQQKLQAL
jgi:tetratricopeptide (TPR) repeat protein